MRRYFALVLAGAVLAAPATALAQDEGYKPVSSVLGEVGSVQAAPSGTSPSAAPAAAPVTPAAQQAEGQLPFTGMELGIVAGLGILLVVAGVGVRRLHPHS